VDFNLPSNWWVRKLQKSKFAVLDPGCEMLGMGLDNRWRTTKNAYRHMIHIYSLWLTRVKGCSKIRFAWKGGVGTDYEHEFWTGPASYFASTTNWFVTRSHQKLEVCNSGINLSYKIPISSSYFTASQNGTTRQTDESRCPWMFCIPYSKTDFTD
jgi:hypothetical protein